MSSETVLQLLVGVAVLGLLIYRQLVTRRVRGNQRILLILLVVGLIAAAQYFEGRHVGSAAILALAGSLVLAVVFGAARAATVHVWVRDGQAWMKGNLITAALWVVAVAGHLGFDYLVGRDKGIGNIGNATVLLYLAVTLAVQRVIVQARAQRIEPAAARPVA